MHLAVPGPSTAKRKRRKSETQAREHSGRGGVAGTAALERTPAYAPSSPGSTDTRRPSSETDAGQRSRSASTTSEESNALVPVPPRPAHQQDGQGRTARKRRNMRKAADRMRVRTGQPTSSTSSTTRPHASWSTTSISSSCQHSKPATWCNGGRERFVARAYAPC